MNRILIIDDDLDICTLLDRFLKRNGYETVIAHSGHKGIAKCKEESFDIVLCDFRLGDVDGREVLRQVKMINPYTIVIIITGYSDIKTAIEVIKHGAFDYITKPLIPDEVLAVIRKSLEEPPASISVVSHSKNGNDTHKNGSDVKSRFSSSGDMDIMVGEAPATKELYRQIELVAPTPYSIILYGESGSGKEVVAQTIHERSERRNKPFVAVDCGTLSKELAGSELFGHMKGSFTGALNDKEGHFELANGGTLFLDEVSNLSYDIQASLLRVIQERKFKRVGGTREMGLDIRIIVASNENLQDAYRKGKFREDLYHRFNEFSINIPSLRNRTEDIPLFARFFLEKTSRELNKNIEGFEDEVMHLFLNYSWPGNLREFRNVIRRAALMTNTPLVNVKSLPWEMTTSSTFLHNTSIALQALDAVTTPSFAHREPDLKNAASQAEYQTIMNVLKQVKFNKTRAAEILKIDRKTLYNKLKSYESGKVEEQ